MLFVKTCQRGLSLVELRRMKTVIYPQVDRKLKEKRKAALSAVKQAKGNVSSAAKMLGISRQMLYVLVPGGFHSK
jgi:transcriptional regulator of acetoin/glycerol metabolism